MLRKVQMEFAQSYSEKEEKSFLTWLDLVRAVSNESGPKPVEHIKIDKQKERLGRFFKKDVSLPMIPVNNQLEFEMKLFGLYDTSASELMWRKKEVLVMDPIVYIAVTGSGKTYQIQKHAAKGFVCYTSAAVYSGILLNTNLNNYL